MAKSRARKWFANLFWITTKTNVLGWAVERQNIITRKHQHLRFDQHGSWQPGKLPEVKGPFNRK